MAFIEEYLATLWFHVWLDRSDAASERGNVKKVKSLIMNKSDVNTKNNDECTALILAAEKGHKEITGFYAETSNGNLFAIG